MSADGGTYSMRRQMVARTAYVGRWWYVQHLSAEGTYSRRRQMVARTASVGRCLHVQHASADGGTYSICRQMVARTAYVGRENSAVTLNEAVTITCFILLLEVGGSRSAVCNCSRHTDRQCRLKSRAASVNVNTV
jgi:hypothetical protein